MTFGLNVWKANGASIADPSASGGRCFVGTITRAPEATNITTNYVYPDISSGTSLRVYQVGAGAHDWYTSTVSNQAVVTLVANARSGSIFYSPENTVLLVFSISASESLYGLSATTDSGDKNISNIFPSAEFLGKYTMNPTPYTTGAGYSATSNYPSYWHHSNNLITGTGRTLLFLWNIPSSTDVWYTCDSSTRGTLASGVQTYISCKIFAPTGTSYVLPEAFVFAVDGLQPSNNSYGVRLYNSTGGLTFDSGLDHMVIKGFENSLFYTSVTTAISNFTANSFTGIQPVFLLPEYTVESWARNGSTYSSTGNFYEGVLKRTGNVVYSRTFRTERWIEDYIIIGTYKHGTSSGLIQVVVDGALYGASTI